MDDWTEYAKNPATRDYYFSLPPAVQQAVLASGLCFSTLGELQMWAEYYMQSMTD